MEYSWSLAGRATDPDRDALTFRLPGGELVDGLWEADTRYGQVRLNPATAQATYRITSPDFNGFDSFVWTASDGLAESFPADVAINVAVWGLPAWGIDLGLNDIAVERNGVYTSPSGLLGILSAPASWAGLTATVPNQAHGTISIDAANERFTFQPATNFVGTAYAELAFTFGPLVSRPWTVTFHVHMPGSAPTFESTRRGSALRRVFPVAPGSTATWGPWDTGWLHLGTGIGVGVRAVAPAVTPPPAWWSELPAGWFPTEHGMFRVIPGPMAQLVNGQIERTSTLGTLEYQPRDPAFRGWDYARVAFTGTDADVDAGPFYIVFAVGYEEPEEVYADEDVEPLVYASTPEGVRQAYRAAATALRELGEGLVAVWQATWGLDPAATVQAGVGEVERRAARFRQLLYEAYRASAASGRAPEPGPTLWVPLEDGRMATVRVLDGWIWVTDLAKGEQMTYDKAGRQIGFAGRHEEWAVRYADYETMHFGGEWQGRFRSSNWYGVEEWKPLSRPPKPDRLPEAIVAALAYLFPQEWLVPSPSSVSANPFKKLDAFALRILYEQLRWDFFHGMAEAVADGLRETMYGLTGVAALSVMGATLGMAEIAGDTRMAVPRVGDAPKRVYSARALLRRAEEPGPFHNFPESFNQAIFNHGSKKLTRDFWQTAKPGLSNDLIQYTLRGSVNGYNGTFEIGVRPSISGKTEVIMHRFFRPD